MSGMMEGTTTKDYRNAIAGEGPRAYDWEDKPHRLVYDLCGEVEMLSAKLTEASEFIQKLGPTIDYDIVAEIEEMLGE